MSKFLLVLLSISILFIAVKTEIFKTTKDTTYDKGLKAKDDVSTYTTKVATSKPVEIINGYTLPPEPDETLNNSTLLGIDSNGNGVRDDVERWIYKNYKDKHPIYIDIAMQAARNFKLILLNSHDAKKIHYKATEYIDCKSYYQYYANDFNEKILIKDDFDTEYLRKKIYFNTSDREEKYSQYSVLLSGDSYSLLPIETLKSKCDFNTNKYEE
jgi:hypothetical protein